jgi:hypothetical protein
MQYDMHYYATYALAAAAGIPAGDAQVIATSAQFVDDHDFDDLVVVASGEGIMGVATAHHPLNAGVRVRFPSVEEDDCRMVWVPFHFLPGNDGATFHERLRARKDSAIARGMLDYYLQPDTIDAHREHVLQLIGIAAHVYADTFSHYGFSGISSTANDVKVGSIQVSEEHSAGIRDYIARKLEHFRAEFGSLARLGHGAVATYPDRPYLRWSFEYASGEISRRDNPATFLEACAALHTRFSSFADAFYGSGRKEGVAWSTLEGPIREILAFEGGADDRAARWSAAMKDRRLGKFDPAPAYDHQPWLDELRAFQRGEKTAGLVESNGYRFFAAADYHRNYVLKRLLPGAGLLVA